MQNNRLKPELDPCALARELSGKLLIGGALVPARSIATSTRRRIWHGTNLRDAFASMPALNRLCDQALSNPRIAGLAKPAIDALRARLQMLAQA
jgi:hypothetical protein